MKGRINVLDDGGVILNANTVNKEILQGNIVAGDFVEYKTEPLWIDQTQSIDFKFNIGEYAIALIGTAITAFKNGAQIASYTEHGCSILNKYGNYIVFYDNNTKDIGVLSVSDSGFSLVSTLSTGENNVVAIAAGNGEICTISSSTYHDSAYYTPVTHATISEGGILSDLVESEVPERLYGYSNYFLNYASGFYLTLKISQSNPERTAGAVITRSIMFDSDYIASFGEMIQCGDAYAKVRQVYQNGSVIGLAHYYYYASSQSVSHGQTGYLKILDIATGSYVDKTFPNYGEVLSCISNGHVLISECIQTGSSGYATFWRPNKLKLCTFNDSTYEVAEVASRTFTEYFEKEVQATRGCISGNFAYVQLYQDATAIYSLKTRVYETVNGRLDDKAERNYVKTYSAGNPIGVAKESGAAGDTIPVYIPTPSI